MVLNKVFYTMHGPNTKVVLFPYVTVVQTDYSCAADFRSIMGIEIACPS